MADNVVPIRPAPQGIVPPHDLEAERAIICAVLVAGIEALVEVEAIVTAADFYHPTHAVIFDAALRVHARHEPVDPVTVVSELRATESLGAAGGIEHIWQLTDLFVTLAHTEAHARIVAQLAQVRRVIATAHEVTSRAFGKLGDITEFVEWTERRMLEACSRRSKIEPKHIREFVQESFERFDRIRNGSLETGMRTGYRELDDAVVGMLPGQLVIVAARPAMGKSSLAMNIADNVARRNEPVMLFSQEMPGREYTDRQLASASNIDGTKLKRADFTPEEYAELVRAAEDVHRLPITIDETRGCTVGEIASKARRLKARSGLSLLVVDHLGLVNHQREEGERSEEAIGRTTRALRALGQELHVPVIALSQLNRECEKRPNKRPMLSDLRDSGNVEQDADVVLFLYRDEVYRKSTPDKGIAELNVAKQRSGPGPVIRLAFREELTRFEGLADEDPRHDPPGRSSEPDEGERPRRERKPRTKSQRDFYAKGDES